jgi:hypothetical protein
MMTPPQLGFAIPAVNALMRCHFNDVMRVKNSASIADLGRYSIALIHRFESAICVVFCAPLFPVLPSDTYGIIRVPNGSRDRTQ